MIDSFPTINNVVIIIVYNTVVIVYSNAIIVNCAINIVTNSIHIIVITNKIILHNAPHITYFITSPTSIIIFNLIPHTNTSTTTIIIIIIPTYISILLPTNHPIHFIFIFLLMLILIPPA